jgi:hypothetical protein
MKNLAGVKDCDITIADELKLAGIDQVGAVAQGEVPYSIEGKIGKWRFWRLWYYWSASVVDAEDGVPMKEAIKFNNKKHPQIPNYTLGDVVRVSGYAGGDDPKKHGSKDADGNSYITHYHIDDQVGLNEFVKLVAKSDRNITIKKKEYDAMVQMIADLEAEVTELKEKADKLRHENDRLANAVDLAEHGVNM